MPSSTEVREPAWPVSTWQESANVLSKQRYRRVGEDYFCEMSMQPGSEWPILTLSTYNLYRSTTAVCYTQAVTNASDAPSPQILCVTPILIAVETELGFYLKIHSSLENDLDIE